MSRTPIKHNPAFLEDHELVSQFVVRETDLSAVLETLRENTGAASNQHMVVIGPRGMGKTTLLHRVAAEVLRAPDLRDAWQPIRFGEEAYTVSSVGELWLEALLHLANDTGDTRWRDVHASLINERDEKRLQTLALGKLMDFAREAGKRLVIIVENLQMLLDDEQIDRTEAWALRHTLQTEPRVMLLASATSRFDALADPKQAMFDLFKVHELRPLDDDATRVLWAKISGTELLGQRIRPIRILTGGNPRMVVIMAVFAAGRSFQQLMSDLMLLVDEHTTYFKANVEELPLQERKVFVHLADIWKPSTAREVAARARMDVSLVSANLKRLVQRGIVREIDPSARVRLYQVAERMYNIYHLLRSRTGARDQVRALVEFMVHFYDPRDLAGVVDGIAREACELGSGERKFHFAAVEELLGRLSEERRKSLLEVVPRAFFDLPDQPLFASEMQPAPTASLEDLRQATISRPKRLRGWFDLSRSYSKDQQHKEAEAAAKKLVDLAPTKAWVHGYHALTLAALNQLDAAEDAARQAIGLDESQFVSWLVLVNTLLARGRVDEALAIAEDAAERFPQSAEMWVNLATCYEKQGSMRQYAIAAWKQVLALDPGHSQGTASLCRLLFEEQNWKEATDLLEAALVVDQTNEATYLNLGAALAIQGQFVGAQSVLENGLGLARGAQSPTRLKAEIQFILAMVHGALGDGDKALDLLNEALSETRFVEDNLVAIARFFTDSVTPETAANLLDLLGNSPARQSLHPIVIALKLFLGESVSEPQEVMAVALDVKARIEERIAAAKVVVARPA